MKEQSFITPIPGCLTMGKNKTAPSDVDSPRRLNHSEQQQQQQVKIIGYQAEWPEIYKKIAQYLGM